MAQQKESNEERLIHGLMNDLTGGDIVMSKDELSTTISNILRKYNLSTDMSFIEKIATMKFPDSNEKLSIDMLPKELTDAAFLPVTTIADIALRQDLDMVVSQIPEWYNALIVTRDAICESDIVDGTLARTITFDKTKLTESEETTIMEKIKAVEEKHRLHAIIKNHIVYNTLFYGEGYVYCVPYAKVFEDLYKYRLKQTERKDPRNSVASMFETSSSLTGYGYAYGEAAVERSLKDTYGKIVQEQDAKSNTKKQVTQEHVSLFSEQEIIEIIPGYHAKPNTKLDPEVVVDSKRDDQFDDYIDSIASNIRYIEQDIALPVIEESALDLKRAYDVSYGEYNDGEFVKKTNTIFESVMNDGVADPDNISREFKKVPGMYIKVLPATKLIPIRIDRTVIGYYYISDLTRPDDAGERRNSGLSGYTLRTPSIGHDTFSPDRMLCERLATKIINNFNLKFMRDNTALHQQIVTILEAHKFNEAMMRFIYIPAENVCQCTINEDGAGKGHSMLEGGLITARMYMFLKMYSILWQINNSAIRVYNLRSSGIDKNYKQFIQQLVRKFSARRVTSNDIFNYRSSLTKVTGGSELVLPMGPDDKAPVTIENIPAAESPLDTNLLDKLHEEAINSTPVPAIMVKNGGVTEVEFSKEVELSNTRFVSFISSTKIDMNRDITVLYRRILLHETDIDPAIIHDLRFSFHMPAAKTLSVTSDMINNFEAIFELAAKTFLRKEDMQTKDGDDDPQSPIMRAYKKLLMGKYLPQLDVEEFEKMAEQARLEANNIKVDKYPSSQNLIDSSDLPEEGKEEGEE